MIRDGVVKKPRKGKSTPIVVVGSPFREVKIPRIQKWIHIQSNCMHYSGCRWKSSEKG